MGNLKVRPIASGVSEHTLLHLVVWIADLSFVASPKYYSSER
jgi:hypothetical protein